FCLVLQDLRTHQAMLCRAPFWSEFLASPVGVKLLHASEAQKLTAVEEHLKRQFQIDWPRLRDQVLGDAVVFAYRPGPPGQSDQEQGLFLVWARDDRLLGDLIERLNRVQQEAGAVKRIIVHEYGGAKYYQRVETRGDHFYYLSGHVLAFTTKEGLLRQA